MTTTKQGAVVVKSMYTHLWQNSDMKLRRFVCRYRDVLIRQSCTEAGVLVRFESEALIYRKKLVVLTAIWQRTKRLFYI